MTCRRPFLKSFEHLMWGTFFHKLKFLGSHSNMFCQNTACSLVTVNLIIQNGSTLRCSHHCHFFWVVLFPVWLELKQIVGAGTTKTENYPCNLNENNIIKNGTMEVWLYSLKYNFTPRSFVSLQTTGSLVKQSSTDWKAAWVCEMVGKNKRDARQEKGICRGIKALHACWLVPYPSVHSSGAVCKTLQSSANTKT